METVHQILWKVGNLHEVKKKMEALGAKSEKLPESRI